MKIPEVQNDLPHNQIPHLWGGRANVTGPARMPGRVWDFPIDGVSYRGLVGYWPFPDRLQNTTFRDFSPEDNTGTNDGTSASPSGIGECRVFDGVDNNIKIGQPASLDLDALSIVMWVNPDDVAVEFLIGSHTDDDNYCKMYILIGEILFYGREVGTFWQAKSTPTLGTGSWAHLAVTVGSGGEVPLIYINGDVVATHTTSNEDVTHRLLAGGDVYIGERGGTNHPYNGNMDEVRIYNRVLTAEEIKAIGRRESRAI